MKATKTKKTDRYGRLHLDPFPIKAVVTFDAPTRITNASSREVYRPPAWLVREGGDDNRALKSVGLRC